jgi:rhombotail lipoprotein
MKKFAFFILFIVLFSNIIGCAHQKMPSSNKSVPLSSFIEPIRDSQLFLKKAPLKLPSSVSIIFVPSELGRHDVPYTTLYKAAQELKKQLLASPKYISSVNIVQAEDASRKISLGDIRSSYGTDIVIVLSYLQDQRYEQPGLVGFWDITIVGAFVVPSVKINTSTLVDAKVVHVPNDALIFATSAIDERSKHSTSYDEKNNTVEESLGSIIAATLKIGDELTKTLTRFENYDISQAVPMSNVYSHESGESVDKKSNDYWKRVDTFKSSGGGAFGFIPFLISLALFCIARRRS